MDISRTYKKLFIFIMAALVTLPGIGALTGTGSMTEEEIREQENHAKTQIGSITDIPVWLEENLGGRKYLLQLHSSIIYDLFNQSPHESLVQVGKQNWLFLGDSQGKTFSLHSGAFRSPQWDNARFGENCRKFISTLAEWGIPVILAIAPEKDTIYYEYYPKWVKNFTFPFPRDKFDIDSPLAKTIFLDQHLFEAKNVYPFPLYYQQDSHWNLLGGYVAYDAIMSGVDSVIAAPLKRVKIDNIHKIDNDYAQDLQMMIGITRREQNTVMFNLIPDNLSQICLQVVNGDNTNLKITSRVNPLALNKLKVLIIHDSFYTSALPPYINTFSQIHEVHVHGLNSSILDYIRNNNIELVIIMIVERNAIVIDQLLAPVLSPS